MRAGLLLTLLLLASPPAAAQDPPREPVVGWADKLSWGTAFVNAAWGAYDAAHSERPGCHLGQLAISGAAGLGGALLLQQFTDSPRPCCPGSGMPSAHAAAGWVGFNQATSARRFALRVSVGIGTGVSTAVLRPVAHRHTRSQVTWGSILGLGGDLLGQLLHCD